MLKIHLTTINYNVGQVVFLRSPKTHEIWTSEIRLPRCGMSVILFVDFFIGRMSFVTIGIRITVVTILYCLVIFFLES